MNKKIVIIAGEASADMHAAALVRELKKIDPALDISGIGSRKMSAAGAKITQDLTSCAIIGFAEILKYLPIYKKAFRDILGHIQQTSPGVVILIDYPGFNLRLAKEIKRRMPEIKIVYYISPQIWAWGKKRIHLIKKIVDKMIVVFDFEFALYKKAGMDVEFFGHPLLEHLRTEKTREQVRASLKLDQNDDLICLMPGSRVAEIQRLLPVMLAAAKLLKTSRNRARFILIKSLNINDALFNSILSRYPEIEVKIITADSYDYIKNSDFAWVCSGTATLETAILGTPMLIVYKTSALTYFISRRLIKLKHIGLANIVAQEEIVRELVQHQATAENIEKHTLGYLQKNAEDKQEIKRRLSKIRSKLGETNASEKIANCIYKLISR